MAGVGGGSGPPTFCHHARNHSSMVLGGESLPGGKGVKTVDADETSFLTKADQWKEPLSQMPLGWQAAMTLVGLSPASSMKSNSESRR